MPENKINKPLVSVIIPCYNCAQYLSETLDSIYAQTYANWECVIVDDGSIDNSGQIAKEYVQKDRRYKYIYQSNKGVSTARNNAIANSSGKYILPLDADDKISAKYAEEAVDVLEKNMDIKLVYCKAEFFGKAKGELDIQPFSIRDFLTENTIFCSSFFRRDDYNTTKGYSEEMTEGYEDWDFWLSLIGDSGKVFLIPRVHFYYRIRENSRNSVIDDSKQKKLRLQLYNRHKDLYDKYFCLPYLIYDYYLLKNQFNVVSKSEDYSVGKFIMRPYWFLKRIFK
jgi:glycosyltransferase involved in cell wall biosynthesis